MDDFGSGEEQYIEQTQDQDKTVEEQQKSDAVSKSPAESEYPAADTKSKKSKYLGVTFIVVLSVLSVIFYILLYCSHRGYLLWAANKVQAENEVKQIQESGRKERAHQIEILSKEKSHFQKEKQNILADSRKISEEIKNGKAGLSSLNADKARLEAYLSSKEKEVALLDKVRSQTEHLQGVKEQLQKDIESQKVVKAQYESRNSMLKQQESEIEKNIDSLQKKYDEIEKRISESKVLTDEIQNLENQIKQRNLTIGHLAEEKKLVDELKNDISTLQKNRELIQKNIQEQMLAKERLAAENQKLQNQARTSVDQMTAAQEKYKSIQEKIAGTKVLTDIVQNLEIQIKQKKAAYESIDKEKQLADHLRKNIQALQDDKEKIQQEIADEKIKKVQLRSENSQLTDQSLAISKQVANFQKQYNEYQEKIAESKFLVEEVKKLERQLAQRQDVLKQLQANKEEISKVVIAEQKKQEVLAVKTEQVRVLQQKAEEQLRLENQSLSEIKKTITQKQLEKRVLTQSVMELKQTLELLKMNSKDEFAKYNDHLKNNGNLQQSRLKLLEEIGEAKMKKGQLTAEISLLEQQKKELAQDFLTLKNMRQSLRDRLQADLHSQPEAGNAQRKKQAVPERQKHSEKARPAKIK